MDRECFENFLTDNENEQSDGVFIDEFDNNSSKLDLTEPVVAFLRYFQFRKGDANSKCRICGKAIARKCGNTTGMEKHLKQHQKFYKEYSAAKEAKTSSKRAASLYFEQSSSQKPPKQMNIEQFRPAEKWSNTHPKSEKIDNLILRFICLSCEPIMLTEKNGFAEVFEEACPSYQLKSRRFMTTLLEEKYQKKFNNMKSEISRSKNLSFTTDIWSNVRKKKSFLSLTAHYIDSNLDRNWRILTTQPMPESHSGHNISIRLNEIITIFGIEKSHIHIFLRDAASSMICAVEELGYEHFDCFCHKIQLALKDGLEHRTKSVAEIKTQIHQCRELVAFFNRSKNFTKSTRINWDTKKWTNTRRDYALE